MTEQDWFAFNYPSTLLDYVRLKARKRDRKLRLFACGLCRHFLWELLVDDRSRKVVETNERYGDGEVLQEELVAARRAAKAAVRDLKKAKGQILPEEVLWAANLASMVAVAKGASAALIYAAVSQIARGGVDVEGEAKERVERRMCELIRDVFGNPFRPVSLDPSWLSWHDGLLVSMDQRMYDSRDFTDMPVLADALEEAGCMNPDILEHCRGSEPHVRGCWVVDILLGKE